jgi:hypothetical protein
MMQMAVRQKWLADGLALIAVATCLMKMLKMSIWMTLQMHLMMRTLSPDRKKTMKVKLLHSDQSVARVMIAVAVCASVVAALVRPSRFEQTLHRLHATADSTANSSSSGDSATWEL